MGGTYIDLETLPGWHGSYWGKVRTVKSISIIPFIYWLWWLDMALIKLHVNWQGEIVGPWAPPRPKLYFIVSICTPQIKNNDFSNSHVDLTICLHRSTLINEGSIDRPSNCSAPRSHGKTPSVTCLHCGLKFGPWSISLTVNLVTSFSWFAKQLAKLSSHFTVRSKIPQMVGTERTFQRCVNWKRTREHWCIQQMGWHMFRCKWAK